MEHSKKTIAIPPGATIKEQLEDRGMMQKEFALRMGLSEKHVSRLINGQVELSQDVALRLESVLGVTANFWNNLEALYREKVTRAKNENDLEQDIKLTLMFPYSKMVALGWIEAARSPNEKAANLRRYFEVAKLDLLDELGVPGIACRRTKVNQASNYALAAWAQKVRIEARKSPIKPINIRQLEKSVPRFRNMTLCKPNEFCSELTTRLAECGISLVFLPHIDGSFLHGAVFMDGHRLVMGLTVRGRDADKFWFSFFHELGHIIRGHISDYYEVTIAQEEEADVYARDSLIPPEQYREFIQNCVFAKESIIDFAKSVGIAPGIVVGRLQKESYLPYTALQELKEKYQISC